MEDILATEESNISSDSGSEEDEELSISQNTDVCFTFSAWCKRVNCARTDVYLKKSIVDIYWLVA